MSAILQYEGQVEQIAPEEVFCTDIINTSYSAVSRFEQIPSLHSSEFLLGRMSVFRVGDLRASRPESSDFPSAYEHIGAYRLARYLDINRSAPLDERGFFSWNHIYQNGIKSDPDLDTAHDDDIIVLAYNEDGNILGHLGISQLSQEMAHLPLDPDLRDPVNQRLEMEHIFGPFLSRESAISTSNIGNARLLTRFSRVSRVPGVPPVLNGLAKGKISTHLIATALVYLQGVKDQEDIRFLLFDGERHASRSIELLGLGVNKFDNIPPEINIPPGLEPRYTINNKGPVLPHMVNLAQLDLPSIRNLSVRLERGSIPAFLGLVFKQVMMAKAGKLIS